MEILLKPRELNWSRSLPGAEVMEPLAAVGVACRRFLSLLWTGLSRGNDPVAPI